MTAITKAIFCTGMVMAVIWIFMYIVNINKFDREIESAPKKMYLSIGTLIIGFSFIKYFHVKFDRVKCGKLIKKLSSLYGELYANYYLYVIKADKIGIIYTGVMLALIVTGIFSSAALGVLVMIFGGLVIWNEERSIDEQVDYKKTKMVSELPVAISKLTLLVGAGKTLRNAWEQTAVDGEGLIYEEMRKVVEDKANGATDEVAFGSFANRFEDKNLKKFAVSMVQNLQKGDAEQIKFLKEMSNEMWDTKKKLVMKKLEDAKSLMILPLFMIFIGILIMIIAPMLGSVGSFF